MKAGGFWIRWVVANAAGELAGLGGGTAILVALATRFGEGDGEASLTVALAVGLLMLAVGVLEGAVVGAAQWLVLRREIPGLTLLRWSLVTATGALAAWLLGVIPFEIMSSMSEQSETAAEPPLAAVLLLAAVLGLVAGPVLAFFQWLELRRHVAGALVWLPANAAAWALAMPVVFLGAQTAPSDPPITTLILIVALSVSAAGAAAGAVHGIFLVRLLKRRGYPGTGAA